MDTVNKKVAYSDGESPKRDLYDIYSINAMPMPEPQDLKATVDSLSQVTLSWTNVGDIAFWYTIAYKPGYEVPVSCLVDTLVSPPTSATTQVISGLSTGPYSFRICTTNAIDSTLLTKGSTISVGQAG